MLLYVPVPCADAGYRWCFDRTSVHLCASSLQNLAIPQDFYFPLSVSVERSWWPCIRRRGIGWFKEQGQCFFIIIFLVLFKKKIKHATRFFFLSTLPHRQGGCRACCSCKVESQLSWDCTDLAHAPEAQGVLPMMVGVRPVNWIYRLWRHCPYLIVVDCN